MDFANALCFGKRYRFCKNRIKSKEKSVIRRMAKAVGEAITDIHCHILYGVDDGSPDLETSMAMLWTAYAEGVRNIILTPHYKPNRHNAGVDTVQRRTEKLRAALAAEEMDISLFIGNEILYFDEAVHLLDAGVIATMAESRYILVEFLPRDEYRYLSNALYGLLSAGYLPILAHIERYECMLRHLERAEELSRMGIYLQVNAGSVDGKYGRDAKNYTRKLLKEELISFVASDAHDTKSRAPEFQKCATWLGKHIGTSYRDKVLRKNAEQLIKNDYI